MPETTKQQGRTVLLPPPTAVRMVWALTGAFSDDVSSKDNAARVETVLKGLLSRAEKERAEHPLEFEYVITAYATLQSSLRSLDTVYKGRTLNFYENEQLREAYLNNVRDSLNFGKSFQDFLKSLPTMTITAAGGLTFFQWLGQRFALFEDPVVLWLLGLGLAGAGYGVNLWFVSLSRRQTQMNYVRQDYDRGLYYEQYVNRVSLILTALMSDLERLHENVFGQPYLTQDDDPKQIIEGLLKDVRPTHCPLIHQHMRQGVITPSLWPTCESGLMDDVVTCPYYQQHKQSNLP